MLILPRISNDIYLLLINVNHFSLNLQGIRCLNIEATQKKIESLHFVIAKLHFILNKHESFLFALKLRYVSFENERAWAIVFTRVRIL